MVETLDAQYKLIKTDTLILGDALTLIELPQKFDEVHITEGNILYCGND